MRRILAVFVFFLFALPVGVSLSGCSKGSSSTFCSGSVGAQTGQVQNITLQPQVGGISLGYAQTGSVSTPSATDCQNNAVSVSSYTYKTVSQDGVSQAVADVNPTTGALCAGQWNRNTPGGVPDYTTCVPTNVSGVAELTAAAKGASSNKVLIYVHPVITSITLGAASTDCTNDPATNCPQYTATGTSTTPAAPYVPGTCVSFNNAAQLVARFFAGSQNITYIAGHATYTAQTPSLVTFNNDTGVATALAPGTTVVTANIGPASNPSTSTAGLFSVCPPKTITISTPNAVNGVVTVNPNNTEAITATVLDVNGVSLTGLNLTYTSTTPESAPVSSTGIAPVFPGSAAINVFCMPPTCNPSPYGNIGLLGTGKPVSSNTITSNTPGSSSTRLWIGSTDSIYIVPVDLTTGAVPSPTKLPYVPNSMVLSESGASIFMGSSGGLMTYNTSSNTVTATDPTQQGTVLAVSPDSNTVVLTDPLRKLVNLYTVGSGTATSYTGVGTRAAISPDSTTVYVTTADNHLLVHSTFSGWSSYDLSAIGATDVTVAIPSVGAFVSGNTAISGRSYCPNTTVSPTVFYPQASLTTVSAAVGDRIAATNDGLHILDARLAASGGTPVMNDMLFTTSTANDGANGSRSYTGKLPTSDCPESGAPPVFGTAVNTAVLTGVNTTAVTGVYPASDSSVAFTTYLPGATATAGATLPAYAPSTNGAGTVTAVTLTGAATAPVTGVFSSDNSTFFAGTSGDNQVHLITKSTLKDTSQLAPKLPSISNAGGTAVPNLIVQYPRTVSN